MRHPASSRSPGAAFDSLGKQKPSGFQGANRGALPWLVRLPWAALASSPCWAAPGVRTGNLAAAEVRAIETVAASRPCAAITAFYLREMSPQENSGEFYLQGCPPLRLFASLLETGDRVAVEALAPTQPNPYSTASCLVKVRWSV